MDTTILTTQQVLDILSDHRQMLVAMGVRELGIFGSYVRGEQHLSSDVDLLVVLADDVSLLRFMQIKLYLERILGLKVDLVEKTALKPRLSPVVLREVRYVERLSPVLG